MRSGVSDDRSADYPVTPGLLSDSNQPAGV